MERRDGMSLTRDDCVERYRARTYDRVNDHYEETVVNPDGTVRHHRSEPLSQHQGHGSAKRKP